MEPISILLVDDELQSRLLLRKFLGNAGWTGTIYESDSVKDSLEQIALRKPQLLILDIQLKNETGFDLLRSLPDNSFEIIFTTAHSEFAVKAFRYSAVDYLMKPIDSNEFNEAITKARERISLRQFRSDERLKQLKEHLRTPERIPGKLTIPTTDGFLVTSLNDIFYCQAVNNYTFFFLAGGEKIISSHTLGYYAELLPVQDFFRPHRSYLINLAHIKMFKKVDGGVIVMRDGKEIHLSKNNREGFLKLFKG